MKTVVNYFVQKILSGLQRKIFVKWNYYRLLDPEHLKICEPLIKRLQQRRSRFRMQNRPRMRIERDRRRHRANRFCPLDDRLHYPLMPEMQPVKNAERQDGRPLDIRVLGAVKNFHQ